MTYTSLAALGTALVFAVTACSDNGPRPIEGEAQLRVVNTTPGTAAIDVDIDGTTAVGNVASLATSNYFAVSAGTHTIRLRVAATATELGTSTVTLAEGQTYTLFASDTTGSGDGNGGSVDPVVAIDTGAVPAAGKVKLRVIHAAPKAVPMDVYLTLNGESLDGATKLVEPFTYGVGSSPDFPGYVERDPGTYQVRMTADGTADVLVNTGPITVTAGQVRTVFLFDSDSAVAGYGINIINEQ